MLIRKLVGMEGNTKRAPSVVVDGALGIASALFSFCFIGVAYYFTDHAGLEKYQLEGVSSLL